MGVSGVSTHAARESPAEPADGPKRLDTLPSELFHLIVDKLADRPADEQFATAAVYGDMVGLALQCRALRDAIATNATFGAHKAQVETARAKWREKVEPRMSRPDTTEAVRSPVRASRALMPDLDARLYKRLVGWVCDNPNAEVADGELLALAWEMPKFTPAFQLWCVDRIGRPGGPNRALRAQLLRAHAAAFHPAAGGAAGATPPPRDAAAGA